MKGGAYIMNKRLHCGAWNGELGAGSGYFGAGSMEGENYIMNKRLHCEAWNW